MAYSTSNPPALVSQKVGASLSSVWFYEDGDSLATVMAVGYFTNAAELGMKAGDKLIFNDSTLGVTYDMTVNAGATTGTAVGATTDTAGYAAGVSTVTLASAGTGTVIIGDIFKFGNDPDNEYRVTTGDTDVSNGGSVVFTPALVTAIGATATGIIIQSDVLNVSCREGGEVLTAAKTLTAKDTGKTLYLTLAGGFATTLPLPSLGLEFTFVVAVAPTTTYTVVTASSANIIHGQVCSAEDAAGDVACAAASDTISFVANKAIIGDWVKVRSDGTSWFVSGMCDVQDGITTTQVS